MTMPPVVVTKRLTLGPWREDDLVEYAAMVEERDPRTASAPPNGVADLAALRGQIDKRRTELVDTGLALLAIRVDDAFAGYCGLTAGHASHEEPELAYELLRRFHGCGYATEAAQAVVDCAALIGRQRLWASVRPWNTESFRVLTKVGFVATDREVVDGAGSMVWWTRSLR